MNWKYKEDFLFDAQAEEPSCKPLLYDKKIIYPSHIYIAHRDRGTRMPNIVMLFYFNINTKFC